MGIGMKNVVEKLKYGLPPVEVLKCTDIYRIRKKINEGKRLSISEKDCITERLSINNTPSVELLGYQFNFGDVAKLFHVEQSTPRYGLSARSVARVYEISRKKVRK